MPPQCAVQRCDGAREPEGVPAQHGRGQVVVGECPVDQAERLRQAAASGKISRDSFISGMEGLGSQVISGFPVSFGPNDHTASSFVEMSMLTGDGRVRT